MIGPQGHWARCGYLPASDSNPFGTWGKFIHGAREIKPSVLLQFYPVRGTNSELKYASRDGADFYRNNLSADRATPLGPFYWLRHYLHYLLPSFPWFFSRQFLWIIKVRSLSTSYVNGPILREHRLRLGCWVKCGVLKYPSFFGIFFIKRNILIFSYENLLMIKK